jgi:hypothetical protein
VNGARALPGHFLDLHAARSMMAPR